MIDWDLQDTPLALDICKFDEAVMALFGLKNLQDYEHEIQYKRKLNLVAKSTLLVTKVKNKIKMERSKKHPLVKTLLGHFWMKKKIK